MIQSDQLYPAVAAVSAHFARLGQSVPRSPAYSGGRHIGSEEPRARGRDGRCGSPLYPLLVRARPAVDPAYLSSNADDEGRDSSPTKRNNRHCPKCQGAAAKEWLAEREAELLPVPYFHVVFTLPGPIADIAYQNKAVIYDLLFKAAAEATLTIAADPKHLGARIGITAVLHTWGSALTHHPHVHMIVPGGGISLDGERWMSCRPTFFMPVRVLLSGGS
jgi:hypothetical protein